MRGHGGSWTITYNVLFERPSSRSYLKNVDWLAFFVSQVLMWPIYAQTKIHRKHKFLVIYMVISNYTSTYHERYKSSLHQHIQFTFYAVDFANLGFPEIVWNSLWGDRY